MREFFSFDTMIIPKIVPIIYWLLLAGVLFSGLGYIFSSFSLTGLLVGLLTMAIGALVARVWCELTIVLFKINDNIKKLAGH